MSDIQILIALRDALNAVLQQPADTPASNVVPLTPAAPAAPAAPTLQELQRFLSDSARQLGGPTVLGIIKTFTPDGQIGGLDDQGRLNVWNAVEARLRAGG